VTNLFQLIDREVWIVTAADGERRGGLVATWVQPSSLDPAERIATVSISANHFTRELVDVSGVFGLHLLAEDQTDLAFNFCLGSGRNRDKLASVAWQRGDLGCPVLDECIASAECRVIDRIEAAGRVLYFADVLTARAIQASRPLREQALVSAANTQQRAAIQADRKVDIEIMRSAIRDWRSRSR
jgi:flavin reductase (DIM6/NTAB) family NADH-FMN oxidoreductase RutF